MRLVRARLTAAEDEAVGLALRRFVMDTGDPVAAVVAHAAAGALGLRDAVPHELVEHLIAAQVLDPDQRVLTDDGQVAGRVWEPALEPGAWNFSCEHPRCPSNLTTYPSPTIAALAALDHWRACPANHP